MRFFGPSALRMTLAVLLFFCLGARNPFEPLESKVPRIFLDDLKHYSFQELTLQATLWDTEKKLALFRMPHGKTSVAKVGAAIGKKGGKITEIGDNIVIVKGSFGEFTFRIK